MTLPDTPAQRVPQLTEHDIYFVETFLRQRGDHQALLAIDALILREDLAPEEKTVRLQETIQGAFNAQRQV
jgi:hypothetical protein